MQNVWEKETSGLQQGPGREFTLAGTQYNSQITVWSGDVLKAGYTEPHKAFGRELGITGPERAIQICPGA